MLHFLTSFLMLAIRVSQTANMFFIVIWGPLKTNEWVACFHTKIPTGCYIDVHAPGLFSVPSSESLFLELVREKRLLWARSN